MGMCKRHRRSRKGCIQFLGTSVKRLIYQKAGFLSRSHHTHTLPIPLVIGVQNTLKQRAPALGGDPTSLFRRLSLRKERVSEPYFLFSFGFLYIFLSPGEIAPDVRLRFRIRSAYAASKVRRRTDWLIHTFGPHQQHLYNIVARII